ncbi:CoA ester lyase [Streptomyces sp. NBC_01498]|uniref:HpcH/HpaI aldolase/citrate lyase family protein n=1 Tax=Streptomyces sp. NBC_01498 TaxID=2975870 RepID=UPI002E7C2D7A|nr:CoA ester lyase [Streptomyces sp. NBC_01498]WTL27380.1 CoA ester lyase [Streptomyces sp. NBC_01498]
MTGGRAAGGTVPCDTGPAPLTWLYAPGDRPDTVRKALASGADAVIVDLEDAVSPGRRAYARAATAELLSSLGPGPVPVHVRVADEDDVLALAGLPGLAGLRLPKVTGPADIHRAAALAPGTPLYALLESALGVENAHAVATAHPSVCGIALGEADLRTDLGVGDGAGLDWPRGRVVVAARAAGLPAPVQSVFPDVRDLDGLAVSCAYGRSLGFFGRSAIHPRQLPVIERAYLPTAREVETAMEIMAAAASGAGALALPDGRFVDAAIVAAARRTLLLAAAHS